MPRPQMYNRTRSLGPNYISARLKGDATHQLTSSVAPESQVVEAVG